MNKPTDPVHFERVELERRLMTALLKVNGEMVGFGHTIRAHEYGDDFLANRLTLQLSAFVWARQDTQVLEFPSSWWQHWKMAHAPRWLTRRWPVRMDKHKVTFQQSYPLLKMDGYDTRDTVHVVSVEQPPWATMAD